MEVIYEKLYAHCSRISVTKFREIIKYFALNLPVVQIVK